MKLKCNNPRLIFNPNLVWLFTTKARTVRLGDFVRVYPKGHKYQYNFPWSDFYAAKSVVSACVDEIDDYILIDDDGQCYPVFMLVPCGKCALCRQKKTEDWCTRCMCESSSSDFPPLFITLTYKPSCRPDTGEDCKRDFQLFMKRLRIAVSRDLCVPNAELRYFARSEKTPKNHYWHIHMLLWNMPYVNCAVGDRNSFQTLIRFVQDSWSNGIVRVERCRDTTGQYVMKYARKEDCDEEYWQLCSRRRGIGYKFAASLLEQVLRNPDMSTLKIPTPTGVVTRSIPSYFKRIWFPTVSVLFPNQVTQACKTFMECAAPLYYFLSTVYGNLRLCDDILSKVDYVSRKYRIHHIDFSDAVPAKSFVEDCNHYALVRHAVGSSYTQDTRSSYDYICTSVVDGCLSVRRIPSLSGGSEFVVRKPSEATLSTRDAVFFRQAMIRRWKDFHASFAILMGYEFNEKEFVRRLLITETHQDYIRLLVDNLPDVDLASLNRKYEIDQDWIASHWCQQEIG